MTADKTIRVTERVFDLEDYAGTHKTLKNVNERLYEKDQDFLKLFKNLIIDEDQKGKIIDHLEETVSELRLQNAELTHEVEERTEEVIKELTQKVNAMNQFTMSITYHENVPTT